MEKILVKKKSKELNSIIGKDTEVIGDVKSKGSIRVDGKVGGNIEMNGSVIIGKSGKLNGNIKANEALISGKIIGNIVVKKVLELRANSSVKGDICTKSLTVESGATLDGKCEMESVKVNQTTDEQKKTH